MAPKKKANDCFIVTIKASIQIAIEPYLSFARTSRIRILDHFFYEFFRNRVQSAIKHPDCYPIHMVYLRFHLTFSTAVANRSKAISAFPSSESLSIATNSSPPSRPKSHRKNRENESSIYIWCKSSSKQSSPLHGGTIVIHGWP